jgi:hypothetical protein
MLNSANDPLYVQYRLPLCGFARYNRWLFRPASFLLELLWSLFVWLVVVQRSARSSTS